MRNRFVSAYVCLQALLAVVICTLSTSKTFSQKVSRAIAIPTGPIKHPLKINDSTTLAVLSFRGACKSGSLILSLNGLQNLAGSSLPRPLPFAVSEKRDLPVHGDITYDFFYRSAIDTPFEGNNIQQHNIRANIHVMVARKIPVVLQVNTRQTNSPWFKNYTDVNLQLNGQAYNSGMTHEMKKRIEQQIKQQYGESRLFNELQAQQNLLETKRRWLDDSRQLQELVESRQVLTQAADRVNKQKEAILEPVLPSEKTAAVAAAAGRLTKMSGLKSATLGYAGAALQQYLEKNKEYLQQRITDSLQQQKEKALGFIEKYKAKEEEYKKAREKLEALAERYNTAREAVMQKTADIKSRLDNGSREEISKIVKQYGQDSAKIFKWYRQISSIRQLSVGRSMLDYSELSARNISVNGLQAVYGNKITLAFATGAVDYRYRDFIVRNYTPIKQYLNLLRAGIGERDKNNLFFTLYQGKKQANTFSPSNQPAVNKLLGFAVESRFRINENNYLLAEAAKSSYPAIVVSNNNLPNTGGKIFNFSSRSNEAYSLQLFSRFIKTGTRIYAQYKHLGRNFQSFSVFNINSDITSWQARIDQYFLKKKLFITAGVRTNDYSNPYVTNALKSNTIFKTLQATLRIKKWPVLSLGYMPSVQLTSLNNQVIESRFYTLVATANYLYHIRKTYMHSGLVYTKFYNDAPDTGFVYYNARNWFLYHNIIGNTITYHTAATFSYSSNYRLLTIDQGLNYKISEMLGAGGGVKWNRLNNMENHFGYYGNIQLRMYKLGELNLSFDRGFIPGLTEKLRKNDFGRATYIKMF